MDRSEHVRRLGAGEDTLRHLHAEPGASLHRLAELTFQTDQSMGALAKRRVDRGLIERIKGPGRRVRHRLTPAGDDFRQAGGGAVDSVLAESLGQLGAGRAGDLRELRLKAAASA